MKRHRKTALALLALAFCGAALASDTTTMNPSASQKVVEILTLDVKPGKRDEFHELYESESLPLLRKWKIDVIAHGPSLHDANSYYVIRSFNSLQDRQRLEDTFYDSDDWKNGPKNAIMSLVDHFAYTVLPADKLKEIAGDLQH